MNQFHFSALNLSFSTKRFRFVWPFQLEFRYFIADFLFGFDFWTFCVMVLKEGSWSNHYFDWSKSLIDKLTLKLLQIRWRLISFWFNRSERSSNSVDCGVFSNDWIWRRNLEYECSAIIWKFNNFLGLKFHEIEEWNKTENRSMAILIFIGQIRNISK